MLFAFSRPRYVRNIPYNTCIGCIHATLYDVAVSMIRFMPQGAASCLSLHPSDEALRINLVACNLWKYRHIPRGLLEYYLKYRLSTTSLSYIDEAI